MGLACGNYFLYSKYYPKKVSRPAMLNKFFDSLEITPNHIKIFLITFIAMSVMVFLRNIGFHSPLGFFSLDK